MRKQYATAKWLRGLALMLLVSLVGGCAQPEPSEVDSTESTSTEITEVTESTGEDTAYDPSLDQWAIEPKWENNAFNGLCFAMTGARSRGLDMDALIDLVGEMNVEAQRHWIHATSVLSDPSTPKEAQVTRHKEWIAKLREQGVTKIVGMSHYWFLPESINVDGMDKNLARSATPYRDTDEGSVYMQFLEMYEESWFTLASTFPEIEFWEVGNETNHDLYLHPLTYESRKIKFTQEEKAEILTDMLFYASRGIHRANPDAIVILPGLAPVTGFECMADFMELIYRNIESGHYGNGSTDTNSYFQAAAWHGYVLREKFNIDKWIAGNDLCYNVMKTHGDGDKKVFLTEFGFSDDGTKATDAEQAEFFRQIYERISKLSYVDSIYPFRLVEDTDNSDTVEVYYGMFKVFSETEFGVKEKGKAICELYGGTLSALDKYIGDHTVYPE